MKLSIIDRIIILKSVLPESGTIADLKLMRSIRSKINFTNEEYSEFKISVPSYGVIQIDEVTEDMQSRVMEYSITSEEATLLKRYANIQDQNGWVTESSLDTIEMLLDYSTEDTIKQD